MACNLCDLGKQTVGQIMPSGSVDPDVYIVFDKPTDDELRFRDLMAGVRGQFLSNSLMSVGITNYRVFSVIRCSTDRNPTDEETNQCLKFLRSDIYRSNPKVILTVGGYATQSLLGITDKISNVRGLVKNVKINSKVYQVIPMYSPTYVQNKSGSSEIMGEFMNDLAMAAKIVTGEYLNPMDRNIMEYALDYETFYRFYEDNLRGEHMLAYDIETNAHLVYKDDFKIVGWSLAKVGIGIYVCLDSLDYTMPEEDQKKCIDLLIDILKETPKIVVHNGLYERPATYFQYGYEIPFDKLEDTLVMAKIMLGGKIGAGLKPNARRIGYPEWDADVAKYIDGFTKTIKRLSLKRNAVVLDLLRSGKTFEEVYSELNDEKKFGELLGYYSEIRDSVSRYYLNDEIDSVMSRIGEKYVEGYDFGYTSIIPYSWIPQRMLCKYGATDSLATFDLYNYFMKRFDEDSTDEVDLHKGYYYDLMEHYTGYELMLAGLHWNDDLATRDYKAYELMMNKSIRAMLLCDHPTMNQHLANAYRSVYGPEIIYNSYNDWFWDNLHRRIEMKDDETYVGVFLQDNGKERRRAVKYFFEELEIPESIKKDIDNKVLEKAKKDILKKNYYELKSVFNPGSTQKWVAETYNDIVLDDDLRVGNFLNKIRDNILQNEEIDRSTYSDNEQLLLTAIENYFEVPAEEVNERRRQYDIIKEYILSLTRMDSGDMQEFLGEMHDLRLDKLSEEFQLMVFESLKSTPINVDDPTTWTDPFKWNFYLRIYKKSQKIISAYLDGVVGRQSVYTVDKKKLQSGDDVVYREIPLVKMPFVDGVPQLPEDKDWLEQTSFGVGTAETGRWRSSYHVIPAGSTVKRLYTSRYRGGTIFQPDFSANELRCVASAAHEESMLQAFRDGMDIHRANASRVFGVPPEEITPFQRRWAKTLCLTGDTKIKLLRGVSKTIEELCTEYRNGTLNEYVYSYHDELNKFIPCKLLGVEQNREETEYIEIELDNGSLIHATKDHPFVMRDGSEKLAEELSAGDSLMAMYFDETDGMEGLGVSRGYETFNDPDGTLVLTHKRVAEFVELEQVGNKPIHTTIHHADYHKKNNHPDNLKLVDRVKHLELQLHYHSDRIIMRSLIQKEFTNNIDRYKKYRAYNSIDHITIEEYLIELLIVNKRHPELFIKKLREADPAIRDLVADILHNEEFMNKVEEAFYSSFCSITKHNGFYANNGKNLREHHSEVHRKTMTDSNKDPELKITRCRNKIMKVLNEMMSVGITDEEIIQNGMEKSFDKLVEITGKSRSGYPRRIDKYFDSVEEAVDAAKKYNHKVKSVRVVHSDTPIKFYGLMVNYCHNFLIDTSSDITEGRTSNSGVIVENSFQILYGGGVHSVAQNYFNGDMKRAQDALDAFYGAFPGLKAWLDSKHEEVLRTHKVSTLTDRFINIDFDPNDRASVNRALRQSGNFPIQSLHFDTEIYGLDGEVHKVGDLAENHEDLWVYTYDTENCKIIPMKGIQAQCTGTTDTWYEIFLDNGKSVKVTPEHKMMLRDGTYCRADELKIGQSLMPLYMDEDSKKSENYYGKIVSGSLHDPCIYRKVHKYVYSSVDISDLHVHHIDMNHDNNSPDNLVVLTTSQHIKLHRLSYEFFSHNDKSVFDFVDTELRNYWSGIYSDSRIANEKVKHLIEAYTNFSEETKSELAKKSMSSRNKRRSEDYKEWDSNQKAAVSKEVRKRLEETGNVLGMDSEEYKKRLSESWAETHDYRVQRLKEGHNSESARKAHSEATKKLRRDPEFIFNNQLKNLVGYMLENNLLWEVPEDWDKNIKNYPKSTRRRYSKYILNNLGWDNFVERAREYASTYNHKVVAINVIHLDKPEPKYDLHIPKYHNFALSCGVFTHNSSASVMAAVIFCDIILYMKKNNYKSKGICFIHDSLESDIYPYELIELTRYQQKELATGAVDYFGIECKADVSMGYSMGHECEMTDIEVLDEDHTKAYITLEGFYNDILDTINHWKLAYHKVEIAEEDLHDQYLSITEMFIARKAFDPTAMNHHKQGKVKIYIQYYNENGEIEPMTDKFESIDIWKNAPVYEYVKSLNY